MLGQRKVADKRGEGSATAHLLAGMDVAAMVLTLDALHTTKKTARLITEKLQAAQALLSGTDTHFAQAMTVEQDRGHEPFASLPPVKACFPAPGRCSGYAATPAAQTANAPANRSSTASPACPPTGPPRTTRLDKL